MDLTTFDPIARQRIDERNHNGVVRPNAAIGKMPERGSECTDGRVRYFRCTVAIDGEKCGSSGSRHPDRHHRLAPVELIVRMMRRFENEYLGEPVERWNAQAALCITDYRSAQDAREFFVQRRGWYP